MTIQLQTPESSAAANADIVKLETAAQAAREALNEFETAQASLPAQYRNDNDGRGAKLQSTLTAARRALDIARTNQNNANVYQSVLGDIQSNMARNAAEKAAQQAQQANENEAAFKVRAEAAYVAAGGTALGFISEWPTLRAELVRQKTLAVLGTPPTNLVDEYIAKRNAG